MGWRAAMSPAAVGGRIGIGQTGRGLLLRLLVLRDRPIMLAGGKFEWMSVGMYRGL